MDQDQFSMLMDKIDKLSRILIIPVVRDISREQDKIELLDSVGFKSSEIAKLLGKSTANVSVVLGNLRKKKGSALQSDASSGEKGSGTSDSLTKGESNPTISDSQREK